MSKLMEAIQELKSIIDNIDPIYELDRTQALLALQRIEIYAAYPNALNVALLQMRNIYKSNAKVTHVLRSLSDRATQIKGVVLVPPPHLSASYTGTEFSSDKVWVDELIDRSEP